MNSKAQAWYMDFVIALLLFTFTLVIYFSYINNFQKQDEGLLDELVTDAKTISSSLVLSGFPTDWDNSSVVRIGLIDNEKLNSTKIKSFKKISYSSTKKRFSTPYDYFVFFVNDNSEVLNVNGVCGVGSPLVNTTYNIKSAYYYKDPSDAFLKDFMQNTFYADIYFDTQLDQLINKLGQYKLLVMEHPLLTTSELDSYYEELNKFTGNGSHLLVSGELVTSSSGKDLNGIVFDKKVAQSEKQRTGIVNNTDQHLELNFGDSMVFDQYYFVSNDTPPSIGPGNPYLAVNYKIIATYNQSDDEAIAKWKYGNGVVYFFSDFNVNSFDGNFIGVAENLIKSSIEGTCNPINLTGVNQKKLVKAERFVNFNSKVAKLVVYVWQ